MIDSLFIFVKLIVIKIQLSQSLSVSLSFELFSNNVTVHVYFIVRNFHDSLYNLKTSKII